MLITLYFIIITGVYFNFNSEFYIENIILEKSYTVKHFLAKMMVIHRAENYFGYERNAGSSHKAKKYLGVKSPS